MKTVLSIIVFMTVLPNALGFGTALLANFSEQHGKVLLNGEPVGEGEAIVQFASLDGELLGEPTETVGEGKFVRPQFLQEQTGSVTLKLAVFYQSVPGVIVYSEPFDITLGGEGVPPGPPAILPTFNDINFEPDLLTGIGSEIFPAGALKKERTIKTKQGTKAKFFRAKGLFIRITGDDSILLNYTGSLEIASNLDGSWAVLE